MHRFSTLCRRDFAANGKFMGFKQSRSSSYLSSLSQEKIFDPPMRRQHFHFRLMSSEADKSADDTNRWSVIPPAALVEMSVGAIYCYSMFQLPLSTLSGVVCPAPDDFTTSEIIPVFSMAAGGLGLSSAALGSWVDKVGPVKAGTIGR